MAQSPRPITTQEARSHSHVMLGILSRDPHPEHAREEGGPEFIQSVQVLSKIGHFCLCVKASLRAKPFIFRQ